MRPIPGELRYCAVLFTRPSRRGEIFELELSAKARVNRMHSEKSAIYTDIINLAYTDIIHLKL